MILVNEEFAGLHAEIGPHLATAKRFVIMRGDAYEEARAHLGMETQRRWPDPAVFRTTPVLLGLCSVVTPYVHQNAEHLALSPRRAAWHPKPAAAFADATARLRQRLWSERIATSAADAGTTEPISPAIQRIVKAACYAP